MKRSLRLLILPFLLIAEGACAPALREGEAVKDVPDPPDPMMTVERCAQGADSDGDGLNNDLECKLGTDPLKADTDGDGVFDGVEVSYPKACVAGDRMAQRRPPPECQEGRQCLGGEECKGLDPRNPDTDGDGVKDGDEDPGRDARIDIARGETDPRLYDTDGDGRSDAMSGLEICRADGLARVTQVLVPNGPIQLGHDPKWGMARAVPGTMGRGALLLDDAAAAVSAAVFSLPGMGDARAESMRIESAIGAAIGGGVTATLTGRELRTHETHQAIASTYLVQKATSASALRDALVMPLVGAAPPGSAAVGNAAAFILDVTTVRRPAGAAGRLDVMVTIAPRADSENPMRPTAIRSIDLVNTSGVAESGKMLGHGCQVFKADRTSMADFIWNVDTSGSMNDDQERLGNTASKFFTRLARADVDFRVGVIQAGSRAPNLDVPGFHFISGSDAMGPLRLCRVVTKGNCPMGGLEFDSPYPMQGGEEEPVASAILTHFALFQREKMGEMNINRRFRTGARVIAFLVTDEPGTNDYERYFQNASDPETGQAWGNVYNDATLDNIIKYFKRNKILTFGLVPVSGLPCRPNTPIQDLPRCVIEGNGGATIKIETAADAEVQVAMDKIVDAVAGATSQFQLDRTPITSTIKVTVRGMDVPRSRSEGFDYDPASRSVVFYGNMYRPEKGDQVVVSYRVWEGSLG